MIAVIGVIVALAVLVTVHEFGHFIAARMCGVYVEKFSLGFGPKLLAFKKGNTEYRISLFLLGGYVKMKGENPDEQDEVSQDSFTAKHWLQKVFISFNGPFFNLLLAFILIMLAFGAGVQYQDSAPVVGETEGVFANYFFYGDSIEAVNRKHVKSWNDVIRNFEPGYNHAIIYRDNNRYNVNFYADSTAMSKGSISPYVPAIIGEIVPGLPAYQAGLQEMDLIVAVNSDSVKDWYEMREKIVNEKSDSVILTIIRDGKTFEKKMSLNTNILEENQKMIGIAMHNPVNLEEKFTFFESIKYGAVSTVDLVTATYVSIFKLFTKPASLKENIASPIMMVSVTKQMIKRGLSTFLNLMATLNIFLMVFNLLPVPVLDGGQIFFFICEGIFRKPLPMRIQMRLQQIGFILLLSLMFWAIFNDITKVAVRSSSNNNIKNQIENTSGN